VPTEKSVSPNFKSATTGKSAQTDQMKRTAVSSVLID